VGANVGQEHHVVRAHRVVVEVVLDGPQAVEAEAFGELGHAELAGVHLLVVSFSVQVAEAQVHSDVRHGRSFVTARC
jgi:hypothetical protein